MDGYYKIPAAYADLSFVWLLIALYGHFQNYIGCYFLSLSRGPAGSPRKDGRFDNILYLPPPPPGGSRESFGTDGSFQLPSWLC